MSEQRLRKSKACSMGILSHLNKRIGESAPTKQPAERGTLVGPRRGAGNSGCTWCFPSTATNRSGRLWGWAGRRGKDEAADAEGNGWTQCLEDDSLRLLYRLTVGIATTWWCSNNGAITERTEGYVSTSAGYTSTAISGQDCAPKTVASSPRDMATGQPEGGAEPPRSTPRAEGVSAVRRACVPAPFVSPACSLYICTRDAQDARASGSTRRRRREPTAAGQSVLDLPTVDVSATRDCECTHIRLCLLVISGRPRPSRLSPLTSCSAALGWEQPGRGQLRLRMCPVQLVTLIHSVAPCRALSHSALQTRRNAHDLLPRKANPRR